MVVPDIPKDIWLPSVSDEKFAAADPIRALDRVRDDRQVSLLVGMR